MLERQGRGADNDTGRGGDHDDGAAVHRRGCHEHDHHRAPDDHHSGDHNNDDRSVHDGDADEPAPTTTVAPEPTMTGIVWESSVDPARVNTTDPPPTFEKNGITTRVQIAGYLDRIGTDDWARSCSDEARIVDPGARNCIVVQFAYDVADDFETDEYSPEGGISGPSLVTPEGKQIDSATIATAYPGTKDNFFLAIFPNGEPGSTLRFTTGSNHVGWTTHKLQLPDAEGFQPVFL